MEIIKHGKKKEPKSKIRFKCKACGCKFVATGAETNIWIGSITGTIYYRCKCPECGHQCDK